MKQTPVAERVALVAEHHLDDVDGGAEVVRDVVGAAVDPRARRLPRVEHRPDRALRAARGRPAGTASRPRARRSPGTSRSARAGRRRSSSTSWRDAAALLERLELLLEQLPVHAVDDLAVHLDQPAVRVEREARVPGRRGERPRPRRRSGPRLRIVSIIPGIEIAAPERTETRSGSAGSPKRLPGALLRARATCSSTSRPELGRDLPGPHRLAAGVRRDREAGRHGDPERGHLREADPLAAEQLAPAGSDLVECVDQAHGADPTHSARLPSRATNWRSCDASRSSPRPADAGRRPSAGRSRPAWACRSSSSTRSTGRPGGPSSTRPSSGAESSRSSRATRG